MISCYCFSVGSWDFSDWCELRSGLPTTRPCFEPRTRRAGRSPELDEQVGLDRGLRARLWQRLRHRTGSEIRSPESGCDVTGSRRHSGERKMAAEEVETCFVLRISQRHRSLKNTENCGCSKIYGNFFLAVIFIFIMPQQSEFVSCCFLFGKRWQLKKRCTETFFGSYLISNSLL